MKRNTVIAILSGIFILYLLSILSLNYFLPDVEERGQFGDSFGVLTSLFTALAFAGVIWTIYLNQEELRLQRKELELQREELSHTREEIRGQKEQLAEQNKSLEYQNFEHSFYQLLNLYDKTINSIKTGDRDSDGQASLSVAHRLFDITSHTYRDPDWSGYSNELLDHFSSEDLLEDYIEKIVLEEITFRREKFNERYESIFKSYFRVLKSILKLIDVKNGIEIENRKLGSLSTAFRSMFRTSYIRERMFSGYYVDILKSQLSNHELAALFYYALGDEELKELIEKYSLLEEVDFKLIFPKPSTTINSIYDKKLEVTRNIFKNLYEISAYGE